MDWPGSAADLRRVQLQLAGTRPEPFRRSRDLPLVELLGGCFVCFTRNRSGPGALGEPGWAAAVAGPGVGPYEGIVVGGAASAGYEPGYLALREGPLLASAVTALRERPDVLLVNASGRDHVRRAGLALHLGAALDIPTVGVTRRPLVARGSEPGPGRAEAAPLILDGEVVGYTVRTRAGARPLAVHAGWRTDPDAALEIVLGSCERARTPQPLRHARRLARLARAWCTAPSPGPIPANVVP